MSLDGFLTFVGLMIATYAVLSPIGRLQLRLNLYRQLALATIAICSIFFFQFFTILKENFGTELAFLFDTFGFINQEGSISNQQMAFLITATWIIMAVLLHVMARPNALSLQALRLISRRLHDEERYLELLDLVSPYLYLVFRAIDKKLWGQKLHYRILDLYMSAVNPFWFNQLEQKSKVPSCIARRIRPLAALFPARKKALDAAEDIQNLLIKSNDVRQVLFRVRPEFSLQIIVRLGWDYDDFRREYYSGLIEDKSSHFYRELAESQLADGVFGYYLDPKNTLLYGLFSDVRVAFDVGIWKPVGDVVIHQLRHNEGYRAILNASYFSDEFVREDLTFNALHFFDLMASCAAKQNFDYHMWIMYGSVFSRELVAMANFDNPLIDMESEFPTLATRLIYEITDFQRKCIMIARQVEVGNIHQDERRLAGDDGGNIPYWAVKDYATTIANIMRSEALPDRFKVDRLEAYLRQISSLPCEGDGALLRRQLIEYVVEGDPNSGAGDCFNELQQYIGQVDHVVRGSVPDFTNRLD
jgi:hypothetical protein